ncbi:translation initiation factor IF-2 [Candidatus Collierbacteria bacterium CG10_big_fil_rev_8_21_14_0_10_44_9]|uniref:Translation initiation factor IF-2 n=1 Tax=Candidatus Collierbacteria bacterium CG10_big_fil_rev_8_21_14_0_10_44_9 TaxID=1974535 RepID=A0A2H0VI28_9BACT|nr:MAG: translation initiation factor IF-2 [Candidatus Collierbacteria bacterium CG10_big_fil_rev_8_21_14_0_10_44_9]
MTSRQPIVVILGHVDHGKTTLLDYIRTTKVADKEAGGITQSIGAYQAEFKGKKLTFIDTPGHAAFSKMRSRGVGVADIVVLVVAGDDSVQPQTIESIKHIQAAQVPFVVAINKTDKPDANVEVVKAALTQHEVFVEGYGGNTPFVLISGKTGEGVDKLLETILLLAELEELPYFPDSQLEAPVIEAKIDSRKGALVSVIVKSGTLHIGDMICTETATAKVRALFNDLGVNIIKATPGTPVQILGFQTLPTVGETIVPGAGVPITPGVKGAHTPGVSDVPSIDPLDKHLNIILKADNSGSLEAIKGSFAPEVKCITNDTGQISESDVLHARATDSIILGFNTKVSSSVLKLAQAEGVTIKSYKIIYELLEYIEKKILKLMEPTIDEDELGSATIIKVFEINGDHIAGSRIDTGRFEVGDTIHLKRGDISKDARIRGIRIGKNEAKKVELGVECGIFLSPNLDVHEKDVIIAYKKKLDDI